MKAKLFFHLFSEDDVDSSDSDEQKAMAKQIKKIIKCCDEADCQRILKIDPEKGYNPANTADKLSYINHLPSDDK